MLLLPVAMTAQVDKPVIAAPVQVDTTEAIDGMMDADGDMYTDEDADTTDVYDTVAADKSQLDNVSFTIDVPEKWTMSYSDSLAYAYYFPQAI